MFSRTKDKKIDVVQKCILRVRQMHEFDVDLDSNTWRIILAELVSIGTVASMNKSNSADTGKMILICALLFVVFKCYSKNLTIQDESKNLKKLIKSDFEKLNIKYDSSSFEKNIEALQSKQIELTAPSSSYSAPMDNNSSQVERKQKSFPK